MEEIGICLAFLLAVIFTIRANPLVGCLVWFLAMAAVSIISNYGWAAWGVILLIAIPMLIIRYLLDKFFPLDENGEVIVKPKPCPVVLQRPDKFDLPNSADENNSTNENDFDDSLDDPDDEI